MKKALIALMGATLLLALAGCTAAQPATEQPAADQAPAEQPAAEQPASGSMDGAALVQSKCSMCHSIDQALSEDRDAAGWTAIVDQMVSQGLQVTPEEKHAIIDHLAQNYGE